ncbi:MAG: hypothetical protein ACI935_003729 [Moritella dasanensis]
MGSWASSLEFIAAVGGGTVIGLMFFGFTNRNVALIAGAVVGVLCAYYFHDFLRDDTVLLGSLVAYGASTIICTAVSLASNEHKIMLSLYILIWPVISAAVLFVIVRAFFKDMAEAKREERDII